MQNGTYIKLNLLKCEVVRLLVSKLIKVDNAKG